MKIVNFIDPLSPKKVQSLNRWLKQSLFALILLLVYITYAQTNAWYTLNQTKQQYTQLKKKLDQLHPPQTQSKQEQEIALQRLTKIDRMRYDSTDPTIYLQEIAQSIPKDARLTLIKREPGKHIELHGQAKNIQSVNQFLQNLGKSVHLNTVKLTYLEPHKTKNGQLIEFAISTRLKKQPGSTDGKNKTSS